MTTILKRLALAMRGGKQKVKTVADHRADILASIKRDEPAYSPRFSADGSPWHKAAHQLANDAVISIVSVYPSREDQLVCIPYGSTWDSERREYRF